MKTLQLLGILSVGALLSACGSPQAVGVAKATDQSVVRPQQAVVNPTVVPENLPANVTAICRDGSYSMATSNICAGKGGVVTMISRYFAE